MAERDGLACRLTDFVVLANDPAVPAVAADWWAISGPHYRGVVDALPALTAHGGARELARLAAAPTDGASAAALTTALDAALDRLPRERARLAALVAAAERHILIDIHRGAGARVVTAAVDVAELRTRPRPRARPVQRPAAHVVIPFRDRVGGARARNLLACLAALADQRGRTDVTVTVVECDAEPWWRGIVAPLVDHYLFARHPGPFNKAWAVNVGVRGTPGEPPPLLCVLDADVLVDDLFLARNLARLEQELAAWLPYRSMYCLDEPSSHAAIRARVERGEPATRLDAVRALVLREPPGACLWVRRECFLAVGGFDERYEGWGGEDDDVVARLGRAGRLVRFDDPLIHLSHPRPQMDVDGRPFNAHLEPMSWTSAHGFGDARGPAPRAGAPGPVRA